MIGSVIAFGVYFTLLGRIGAARTGYTTVMYPVVALLVSTFAENYHWSLLSPCSASPPFSPAMCWCCARRPKRR